MITIFLLAIYNGLFISWQQNTNNLSIKWSKYWHFLGRIIILSIIFDIWLKEVYLSFGLILILLTVFNLSWTIWNFTINITRKLCGANISIWHLGNGGFDGWIKNKLGTAMVWVIGLILVLLNIQGIFEFINA